MKLLYGYPSVEALLADFYVWLPNNSKYTKQDLYLNNQLTNKYIARFHKWLEKHPYA